ncbi:competence type IV pilus minor pilin ComGD [Alkalibacillus aidingensis]|uniref:competence type IV pilus minor pilin ComGD n=1 Tax=Alkalibacillus aidingensis TaxID=2747607 RepID=UPI001660DAD9|nr:competence type IV pilus minor pilin ComGD [Alkalibacillus aidingensis]
MNSKGFTLVEVLIVLSIVTTITYFSLNMFQEIQNKRTINQFFATFEQDIFYIQQYTLLNQSRLTLTFQPHSHGYRIYDNPLMPAHIVRQFDDTIIFHTTDLNHKIRFNTTGNISQPGSFEVIIHNQTYRITFPFGKGRYYVTQLS